MTALVFALAAALVLWAVGRLAWCLVLVAAGLVLALFPCLAAGLAHPREY